MDLRSVSVAWLALVWFVVIPGCGWWGDDDEDAIDEDFSELALTAEKSKSKPSPTSGKLELKLKVGDRFPLLKTVKQTLSQSSADGGLITSTSELNLLLAINVEEIRDGDKRMGVRYLSVRYTHDVAGRKIQYDSNSPQAPIPESAQAYHGLVNNGFSFWIGADNQIKELVGFNDFLRRCVEKVPFEKRQAVWMKLAETSGEDGIANFVDDSIGLLPYNVDEKDNGTIVKVGKSWTRKRQIVRPSPMYLTTTYTVKELSDTVAEIDIIGRVAPAATFGPANQPNKDVKLTINGGHCYGDCSIDRETGLPIKSKVERYLSMSVQLANGVKLEQRKLIETTVRAFPDKGAAKTVDAPAHSGVSQASATRGSINKNDRAARASFERKR